MLTKITKDNFLKLLAGKTNTVGIGTVYLGLSSTAPNENGENITEPSGNGYGRVLIGSGSQSLTQKFGDPADDSITNTQIIYFPESTGSWGAALTHFVLFKSENGGSEDVIGYDELKNGGVASPISVTAENTVVLFREGELTVRYVD